MKSKSSIKEKLKGILKSKNFIIVLCVAILTAFSIHFSYAYLFTVKSETHKHTERVENLDVDYINKNIALTGAELKPLSDVDGMSKGVVSTINIANDISKNANSNYMLTISYDQDTYNNSYGRSNTNKLIPLEYTKIAIYEYNNSGSKLLSGPFAITDLPIYSLNEMNNNRNMYSLLVGSLNTTSKTNIAYQIRIWVSEEFKDFDASDILCLKTDVISKNNIDKNNYNINGRLQDSDGNPINNAIISLHNGSYMVTSDENGNFKINDIFPETYNIAIFYNDVNIMGNLRIIDGSYKSVNGNNKIMGNGEKVSIAAYNYGITVGKLLKDNDNLSSGNSILTSGMLYNTNSRFTLTIDNNHDINNFVLTIKDNEIINMSIR